MFVIPAIDLVEGACVRLTRGSFNKKKEYSSDPVAIAKTWQKEGAEMLHIIDLDGARAGRPENLKIASEIKRQTGLKIQFGGGVRKSADIKKVLDTGIDRVIIGTSAFENKEFLFSALDDFKKRCLLSIDFDSNGAIFKDGWQTDTGLNVFDFLPDLKDFTMDEVIITNISRDGTLEGVDIGLLDKVLDISPFRLIVAGGVSRIEDIFKLKGMEAKGVAGVIIGKALYEGTIELQEAIRIAGVK